VKIFCGDQHTHVAQLPLESFALRYAQWELRQDFSKLWKRFTSLSRKIRRCNRRPPERVIDNLAVVEFGFRWVSALFEASGYQLPISPKQAVKAALMSVSRHLCGGQLGSVLTPVAQTLEQLAAVAEREEREESWWRHTPGERRLYIHLAGAWLAFASYRSQRSFEGEAITKDEFQRQVKELAKDPNSFVVETSWPTRTQDRTRRAMVIDVSRCTHSDLTGLWRRRSRQRREDPLGCRRGSLRLPARKAAGPAGEPYRLRPSLLLSAGSSSVSPAGDRWACGR